MIKHFISLAILVQLAYGQTETGVMAGSDTEVVSEWASGPFISDLNEQCVTDCNRTCVEKCPEAKLCKQDEIECGKVDLPALVWPDCIRDDICVPDDCECKYFSKFVASHLSSSQSTHNVQNNRTLTKK